jgi:hypothetical protein
MPTIPREVHYYRLVDSEAEPYRLRWREVITQLNAGDREVYREVDADTGDPTRIYINTTTNPYRLALSKIRKQLLPSIRSDDGRKVMLDLAENEGLDESTHIVIKDGIMAAEYNHYAPRPPSLIRFLSKAFANRLPGIRFAQLISSDIFRELNPSQELVCLSVKVPTHIIQLVREQDNSLGNALNSIAEEFESEIIEVVLRKKSTTDSPNGLNGGWPRLRPLAGLLSAFRSASKLTATVKTPGERQQEFDLLGEPKSFTYEFETIGNRARSLDSAAAFTTLERSIDENRATLNDSAFL